MTLRVFTRALCAAFFVLLAFSMAAGTVAAQPAPSPSPSPSPAPLREIAHVFTSDRATETLAGAARTTYVVTKQEIIRHGYQTVGEAIASLPGVNLVRYGAFGASANFGIRGSSSSQVLVLVNGMPVAGAEIDNVDLEILPTSGVERIEVVEGGGSTLYGSGSIGGIVNIITTPGARRTFAAISSGSFDTHSLDVETKYLSFVRTIARNDFALPNGTTRPNDDSELTAARFTLHRRLGGVDARFAGGISAQHLGVPGPDGFISPTSRENTVDKDVLLAFARRTAHAASTLDFSATALQTAYTCDTPVDPSCFNSYLGAGTPPFAQLLSDGRVQASLRNVVSNGRSRTIYGIDLARDVARVDDGIDPLAIHAFSQTAAYVQQNWLLGSGASFYAGVRGERDGTQGGAVSPSIGGIVRLSSALTLKANAATAFRAPTAVDLYYPGFSNPALQDERTRVGDVSLLDSTLLGGASLTWFDTSGTNLIVLDANYVPRNVGHASIAGLTFAVRTVPLHRVYAALNVTNLYRAQDLGTNPSTDIYAGQRLPGRGPVFASNLEIGYIGKPRAALHGAGVTIHTSGQRGYVDPTQPLFDQPVAFSSIDAFARFRLAPSMLLTLRGYDLGNERYGEIGGYPMPGRSFALELSDR